MSGKLYHRIKKEGKWTWLACQAFTKKWKQCVDLHPCDLIYQADITKED